MKNARDPPPLDIQQTRLKNGKLINLRLLERRDVDNIWRNFNAQRYDLCINNRRSNFVFYKT